MDPIAATTKAWILDQFLPGTHESELTATTPLITGGILDSLATIRLVSFLEEQYRVVIEPHEATADNLDTFELISALVRSKQG